MKQRHRLRAAAKRIVLTMRHLCIPLFLLAASPAWAAGGKPATKLVCVADTRNLSGISKWIGDVYNDNLWLYGGLVVVTMSGLGLALGLIFDRLIGLFGIELGRLGHHE